MDLNIADFYCWWGLFSVSSAKILHFGFVLFVVTGYLSTLTGTYFSTEVILNEMNFDYGKFKLVSYKF